MSELVVIAEDIFEDGAATSTVADLSGGAGADLGAITAESQTEAVLLENVERNVSAVEDMTESGVSLQGEGEEAFNNLEDRGAVATQTEEAAPNAAERAATGATDADVASFSSKFVKRVKTICSKLKSLATGPFGQTLIKATGEVMKYWFISDMMKGAIEGLDKIVKDATGSSHPNKIETDEDRKTKTALTNFLTVLSAFFNVVSSMRTTLNNAVTLSTSGDMETPGTPAYLYANLSLHQVENINAAVAAAASACTDVLVNIAAAYSALGFPPSSSSKEADKVIPSVLANPQLLNNAIAVMDLGKLKTFTDKVNEMVTTAKKGISAHYKGGDYDTLMAYFKMPNKWNESSKAMEDFIQKAAAYAA